MAQIDRAGVEYSQGICQGGAAILKDGELMTVEQIVDELRRGSRQAILDCSEPVASVNVVHGHRVLQWTGEPLPVGAKLYTHPASAESDDYPNCDTCGTSMDYMPWHYASDTERHLHSCDGCWPRVNPGRTQIPSEHGTNRYGLDMAYFRALFNRELNRPLVDFRPDELARVLARAARTADEAVLRESEFSADKQAVSVPEGWKLVPIEPTGHMLKHGTFARTVAEFGSDKVYAAMVLAAPQPPKQEGQS